MQKKELELMDLKKKYVEQTKGLYYYKSAYDDTFLLENPDII